MTPGALAAALEQAIAAGDTGRSVALVAEIPLSRRAAVACLLAERARAERLADAELRFDRNDQARLVA